MKVFIRNTLFLSLVTSAAAANACDLCSIYSSVEASKMEGGRIQAGVAEQVTSYGKIQEDGHYVENLGHQRLTSSITQVYGAYDLSEKFGLQLNIPYISRSYRRVNEAGQSEKGTINGVGDISLLARYSVLDCYQDQTHYAVSVFGGIKFANGDSDELGLGAEGHHEAASPEVEVGSEDEHSDAGHVDAGHSDSEHSTHTKHNGVDHSTGAASSIHGHDLALGSGSYDFPVGLHFDLQDEYLGLSGNIQYVFRQEGAYDHRHANDLQWDIGPSYYLVSDHDLTVVLKANLSGEYKGKDEVAGVDDNSTALQATYIGPELIIGSGNLSGELAWDAPWDINNSGIQSVADYRLRAALSYRF